MAIEIERKYLVVDDSYKLKAESCERILQGYLSFRKDATIRIRIRNERAYITVKGISVGATRSEWEYDIPIDDAKEMLAICEGTIIDKTRYLVNYNGFLWEIDEFHGRYSGLVVAEIELKAEDDKYPLPSFIGQEVTGDIRYYNSVLSGSSL